MVYLLNDEPIFPNPKDGDEDGLLAVGGDLSTERLLLAYSYGIFPWFAYKFEEIKWWCPMDRFVIFPNEIHISHSMRNLLNKNTMTVTFDQHFDDVIRNCSKLRIDEDGAWLDEHMIEAYTHLHELGAAKSVEVWEDGELIGGLYGVTLHGCFFGESMFSLKQSASKVALIALAQTMQEHGGKMIDCQFETPHLKSMGGRHIPYDEYMEVIKRK